MLKPLARKYSTRHRRGFTLIEVLVVVAIIAALVAILLPSLSRVRKQTRRTLCASNLHQIGASLLIYRESYREFPQQALINVDPLTKKGQAFGLMTTDTHRVLARFLKTGFKNSPSVSDVRAGELFYCPSVREEDRSGDVPGQDQVDPSAPAYLHVTYAYLGRFNMALNDPAECHGSWGDPADCEPKRDIPTKRRLYVTKDPDARRVLMSDMLMYWGGKDRWRINHGPYYQQRKSNERIPLDGSNLVYGDGHAEWQAVYKLPRGFSEGKHPLTALDFRRTANLVRDQDMWWW